jgi:hypothetical protein
MSRHEAALLLVLIDSAIVVIFLIAVIRLKWYEDLFERDRQLKEPKTEDFSVFLPEIPVNASDYENNPELLTVQIATHLEYILVDKFMTQDKMTKWEAEDLSQVSSINFGLTKHHPILYLVSIAEETKIISILRNNIKFDPKNTPKYEQ